MDSAGGETTSKSLKVVVEDKNRLNLVGRCAARSPAESFARNPLITVSLWGRRRLDKIHRGSERQPRTYMYAPGGQPCMCALMRLGRPCVSHIQGRLSCTSACVLRHVRLRQVPRRAQERELQK